MTGTGALTIGTLGASGLTVTSGNGISLSNAGNMANAVVMTNTGAGNILFDNNRNMTLQASDSVSGGTITVVNATGTLDTTGTGVSTNNANIDVKTGGLLTINSDIAAGTGTVYLTSGAGITEGAAKITAATLGMNAAGTIAVNAATNNVTTLAATVSSGTITYQDADALTVGSVTGSGNFPATTGVSTTNANIDIKSGGLRTINNDIVAGRHGVPDERGGDYEVRRRSRLRAGDERGGHDRGERGEQC